MGGLVSQDPTCGVPGCSCSWNLILLRDVLDWVEERKLPLALVSIDQEKVFDRVQHGFLFTILGRMGFGSRFISWVCTVYAGAYSCVRVNGFLSLLLGWCARTRASTVFGSWGRRARSRRSSNTRTTQCCLCRLSGRWVASGP
ncbi:hypothetical protein AAFF_G00116730 [Aldrovandia affinis]|uniref:Reverse transcriptase domain-containing protein n=1 Tax=Aldrovandia affinis TaxID=143900 RepID=A0AAD7WXD7_9TELE|nr:hypothetical protein AAFF_G00116730 [Aldrovandia affinis]